ncbi:FAD binding protein [Actinoalloteichus sp. GBA129-24]|uniref:FAD binding protein n=1 Tax=Actinoalloteichus fjordicus TaxID=1612552 RepID=A0AAC9LD81_9PSEU|nr:FAD-dependent monooxygenase [Actinoalloteichus fjordicus]APU14537.1 FAD binding protein [Actinoalloteichus fjordicus]APU20505.1 FAD binding protein [Actinoalloteichus sp. GBA129-24]
MLADRFQDGRVLLIGDAAHAMPPVGTSGVNTGIADAHNLAWKLAAVLDGHAGGALVETYQAERRPRLPHAWLESDGPPLSTFDLIRSEFTLLTGRRNRRRTASACA